MYLFFSLRVVGSTTGGFAAPARGINIVKRTILTMLVELLAVAARAVDYGVYDFAETMEHRRLAIEETFVNQKTAKGWANATEERSLYDFCTSFKSKGRMPLITIEPHDSGDVLYKVATGKCDAELGIITAHLRAYGGPVIVRWGHEAENSIYPWGGKNPEKYIAAYRHVVGYLRNHLATQKLYFCWSPIGNTNCVEYYPGDDCVSYVGCSLYWTRALARKYHIADGSFQNLFAQKYATLARFHKPIIIAECGVSVNDDQTSWIAGMQQSVRAFPLLRTIVYFNAPDGYAWVNRHKPDWRLRDPSLWGFH
jgi:glycosyl hydrolase family 26